MSAPKIVLSVLWVICLVSVLLPGEALLLTLGRGLFWLLVLVHAVECVMFLGQLRLAPGSLAGHLAQVFLFGVLHMQELWAAGKGR